MKTKITHFLTFLYKMQIFAILCLATYDWFCADGSHLCYLPRDIYYKYCSASAVYLKDLFRSHKK